MSKETFEALSIGEKRALTWQAIRNLYGVMNESVARSASSLEMRNAMLDDPARYIRDVVENLSEFPDAVRDTTEHFRRVMKPDNVKSETKSRMP